MLTSHRTWTEFLRQPADPIWWAKKAIDYQRRTQGALATSVERAQRLAESIWLISSQNLSNHEAIKLLVSKQFLGHEPSRALAIFTAREYKEYLRPVDANFYQPKTRPELVRFLLRRRFTYYPEWMRQGASRKREVDMDSLPESQILQIVQQFLQRVSQGDSDSDALRNIVTRYFLSAAGDIPEPLTVVTYIKHRINRTRRVALPDEFIEWAVNQAVTFFQDQALPGTGGPRKQTPTVFPDARIERLRIQAERRIPESQFRLAKAFLCGEGVRQDLKRGLFWIALARRSGHAGAGLLFAKIRASMVGPSPERLLADAEAAADQYETFFDVRAPQGVALIAHSPSPRSYAGEVSVEADNR